MARRDYASKSRGKPQKKSIPGWVWMLTGLLLGLFIGFLVYLQQTKSGTVVGRQIAKPAPAETRPKPKPAEKPKEAPRKEPERGTGVNFDFYNILPEYEVVVPEEEIKKPRAERTPSRYILQVGSFKSPGDADTRKAELALLGISSDIQAVTINGADKWYRVRIGPIEGVRSLDKTRRLLQNNDIDFMVLKEK